MKVISLNTWGSRAGNEQFLDFIRAHKDVDIFCLQEVWEGGEDMAPIWSDSIDTAMLTNIGGVLENHQVFFRAMFREYYGLAMFVKKDFKVLEEGEVFVYKDRGWEHEEFLGDHARNIQWAKLETSHGVRTIINFHGLWKSGFGKGDNPDRMEQADRIAKFIREVEDPHVFIGDFNLLPENESMKMIESTGLRNLIKEYGITSTRSSHYPKSDKFADYALVSKDIKVNDFKVLPDEISDHLALYLDFE